jgi:hypothetical protein
MFYFRISMDTAPKRERGCYWQLSYLITIIDRLFNNQCIISGLSREVFADGPALLGTWYLNAGRVIELLSPQRHVCVFLFVAGLPILMSHIVGSGIVVIVVITLFVRVSEVLTWTK